MLLNFTNTPNKKEVVIQHSTKVENEEHLFVAPALPPRNDEEDDEDIIIIEKSSPHNNFNSRHNRNMTSQTEGDDDAVAQGMISEMISESNESMDRGGKD